MMLRSVVCSAADLSTGPALSGVYWSVAVQSSLALLIALLAAVLNSRGMRALADLEIGLAARSEANRAWTVRPMVPWEVWGIAGVSCVAVLTASAVAWQATGSWLAWDGGCTDWWRDRVAGVVAGIAAGAAVFVLLDDLRHHGVTLQPVAICFGAAVLWRWLGGSFAEAGEAAVAGVAAGMAFAVLNAGLGVFRIAFGNGDWALLAGAGAWVGADVWGWIVFLAVSTVITVGLLAGTRGRETPACPAIFVATVTVLVLR